MKSDEPEIKPTYKNPLMEHYECDGQISLFDYEEQTQKTDRPENVDESGCPGQISMFDYWDETLKYNETKDDCDGLCFIPHLYFLTFPLFVCINI